MVGHDHGPSQHVETETLATSARNARIGRVLFVVYLVAYVAYMLLTAFSPNALRTAGPEGVNLAVWYGFGLIAGALLLALLYAWLCRTAADDGATS